MVKHAFNQTTNWNKCVTDESRWNMKKSYDIEVDCANCANLMEQAAGKVEGVAKAAVNFMTLKMTIEFAEGIEGSGDKAVMKKVLKACRKIEPDCEIAF